MNLVPCGQKGYSQYKVIMGMMVCELVITTWGHQCIETMYWESIEPTSQPQETKSDDYLTSNTADPTAHATGLPPNVLTCNALLRDWDISMVTTWEPHHILYQVPGVVTMAASG